jgi:site-specific DNA recombinase
LSCKGLRMPMDKLDDIVIREVTKRVLQPQHLMELLGEYLRTAMEREDRNRARLRQMRHDHKEAEAGIARLLELVEKGLMDAGDASLRERLVNLRSRRDELANEISDLCRRLAMAEPVITPEKMEQIAVLLREKLFSGSPRPAAGLR